MLTCKIISDSSSDLLMLTSGAYACVPLKIITDAKEYVDDAALNVNEMVEDLLKYKGTSKSSCPNCEDWKKAFEDYDCVFCVTITSNLSGSCNAANLALSEYLAENPGKRGYVIDTLSAGPEVALIVEKLQELVCSDLSFEDVVKQIQSYQKKTHLLFTLESLRNLANNGRVSGAVAKIAGLLGIRVIGKASAEGTLEVISKAKGEKKALADVFKNMMIYGYHGGRVRIHHCRNLRAAEAIREAIKKEYPHASVIISETRGLCSFYAEAGGVLVGYEGKPGKE
ncbi:MAG: DegV family protein [Clostridia bacterium]|nr:DegV family protein [Clostridia bacterium]